MFCEKYLRAKNSTNSNAHTFLFHKVPAEAGFYQVVGKGIEPLPRVVGNKGTGAFIFREQGIFSNYFQGTRELLNRFLGTREHQSNLKGFFFNFPSPLNIPSVGRDYCYELRNASRKCLFQPCGKIQDGGN